MAFEQFQSLYGGGISAPGNSDTDRLVKALEAGSGQGLSSAGGRALVLQDLEATLRTTTYGEPQFVKTIFNRLKERSEEATGIMHEFIRLTDYGTTGAFSPEIATINPIDVSLLRGYAQIRFLRTKRQVSTVIQFTRNIENAEAIQVLGGTRFLIAMINEYLFDGDSAMSPDEWDGIYKTIVSQGPATHVINKAAAGVGQPLTAGDLTNAAEALASTGSYGVATDLYMPLEIQAGLDTTLIGNQQRIILYPGAEGQLLPVPTGIVPGGLNNSAMYGMPSAGFRTSYGNIMFNANIFNRFRPSPFLTPYLGPGQPAPANAATSNLAPNTPVVTATVSSSAVTGSTKPVGTYNYYVTAEVSAGESAIQSTVTTAVVATAGQTVSLVITAPGGGWGSSTPTCFRIYETPAGVSSSSLSSFYLIDRLAYGTTNTIGTVTTTTGTNEYVDGAQSIPNTSKVYLLDLSSPGELQALGWAQLAPMSREELPRGDTFYQWLQFIYGSPVFYAPNKMIVFTNVTPS